MKAQDIYEFLHYKLNFLIKEYNSTEELKNYIYKKEAVIFFGETFKGNPKYDIFLKVARNIDDVIFATCVSEECVKHFKIKSNDILFFNQVTEKKFELRQPYNGRQLEEFIDSHKTKLHPKLDDQLSLQVFAKRNMAVILHIDTEEYNLKNTN
jgi:hypothetical protein